MTLTRKRLFPAVEDLHWLLSRGYPEKASLQLVGDRYNLAQRQRKAVSSSTTDQKSLLSRRQREISLEAALTSSWAVDGFNLLVTLEVASRGEVVLLGQDGCCRDLASMHGRYRCTEATEVVVRELAKTWESWGVGSVLWWLDRPVSNSGRLASLLRSVSEEFGLDWSVELVPDPDPLLKVTEAVVLSSDAAILDVCTQWCNVTRSLLELREGVNWVDLSGEEEGLNAAL
jgi:hypothetical protein